MNHLICKMELTKEKGIAFAAIAAFIIMATVVFPIWNLFPRLVTETVTIRALDETGCTVETLDHYLIRIGSCTGQPGSNITATFDAKIKQRASAFSP